MFKSVAAGELARFGLLPTDTINVTLVTDEATCTAAIAAYNREKPGTPEVPSPTQAYVIQAGPSRFIVYDQKLYLEHHFDVLVFDPEWILRGWYVS
jgi:hypothetical protein